MPTASPYTVCIAHGGVNDVAQGKTLAHAQTTRLSQIAAIEAAGMRPILMTTLMLIAAMIPIDLGNGPGADGRVEDRADLLKVLRRRRRERATTLWGDDSLIYLC